MHNYLYKWNSGVIFVTNKNPCTQKVQELGVQKLKIL